MRGEGSDKSRRTAHLRVKQRGRNSDPLIYVRWRVDGRQIERPIGPAWMVSQGERGAKPKGKAIGTWRERSGRAPAGFLTPDSARERVPEVVANWEREQDTAARDAEQQAAREQTLEGAIERWLSHRERVKGIRRTTLAEYRSTTKRHILEAKEFKGRTLTQISAGDVIRWRDRLDDERTSDGMRRYSRRTINKARMNLHGILEFACRPVEQGGYGLAANPVRWAEPLREEELPVRDPLEPHEVLEVVEVLSGGLHRRERRHGVGPRRPKRATQVRIPSASEAATMAEEDLRDAAAVLVLGFCGLRLGEVAALRWRHIRFSEGRVRVERSFSAGQETGTKGRETRWVPLPDQVATALAKLGQRGHDGGDDDLVMCGPAGHRLDGSALRRRYKRALEVAGLPPSRLHDLRHGYTTEARQEFSADVVRAYAGHKDARTAQRYAHARSQTDAAQRMTRYIAERVEQATSQPTRNRGT
jgi:integrase